MVATSLQTKGGHESCAKNTQDDIGDNDGWSPPTTTTRRNDEKSKKQRPFRYCRFTELVLYGIGDCADKLFFLRLFC